MRLGIYGGTFDPVHYGHLLLAEYCRDEMNLDQVVFIPAATSPHKQGQSPSSADHRVEMLQLAISGHEPFDISRMEIDRGGVSYSVDTLETIHQERPDDQLFFLMGEDSLRSFSAWRNPQRICELATIITVSRPNGEELDTSPLQSVCSSEQIAIIEQHRLAMPEMGISSTEIRHRVATGKSIRYQTPRAVEKYI